MGSQPVFVSAVARSYSLQGQSRAHTVSPLEVCPEKLMGQEVPPHPLLLVHRLGPS